MLKIGTILIAGIFEQSGCFDEVFLMALVSIHRTAIYRKTFI